MIKISIQYFGGRGGGGSGGARGGGRAGGGGGGDTKAEAVNSPAVTGQVNNFGPFKNRGATRVLAEMGRGDEVIVETNKNTTTFVKSDSYATRSSVWKYQNSAGQTVNMSANTLADIIDSGGNNVIGKIKTIKTGNTGRNPYYPFRER